MFATSAGGRPLANNRPVLSSVQDLQESVHRSVVRQPAGLFGVMAVLGLVLAIIAPFMGERIMVNEESGEGASKFGVELS